MIGHHCYDYLLDKKQIQNTVKINLNIFIYIKIRDIVQKMCIVKI